MHRPLSALFLLSLCLGGALAISSAQMEEVSPVDMRAVTKRSLEYYIYFYDFPTYGAVYGNYPTFYERTVLMWLNVVRHSKPTFGADYISQVMQSSDTSYTNVFSGKSANFAALRWNLNLNRCTRAHVTEYGEGPNCTALASKDCANSSAWSTRLSRWYKYSTPYVYEMSFTWASTPDARLPFFLTASWMCTGTSSTFDTTASTLTLTGCAADGKAGTGARNATNTVYREAGCGIYIEADGALATCDFAYGESGGMYENSGSPIASGSHAATTSLDTYVFIATYDYDYEVTSAYVYVDGTAYAMTLKYGSKTAGTWISSSFTASSSCSSYYFKFNDYFYPGDGVFKTFGLGSCTEDYSSSGGAASCTLAYDAAAIDWNTCNSTVLNGITCSFLCPTSGYSTVEGTCVNGNWSTTPQCHKKSTSSCSLTLSGNASAWGTCSSTVSSGSSCAFSCKTGYVATTGTCSSGSWTTAPSCDKATSSDCTLTLSSTASGWGTCTTTVTDGGSCAFTCPSGFTVITGTCSSGSWTTTPACLNSSGTNCALALPSTASGWGTCSSSVSSGSTCTLSCPTGSTSTTGSCFTGSWLTTPACSAVAQSSAVVPIVSDDTASTGAAGTIALAVGLPLLSLLAASL